MSWHYALGGQQKGPVSEDEFNSLVSTGTVRADTLVWKEGWAEWRAYGTTQSSAGGTAVAVAPEADTAVCAVSGRRRPKSEMLEFEGRWVSAEHKNEFFQRLREGVTQPQDFEYGGFWRRVAAKIIDSIIVGVVNAVIGGVLGGIAGATGNADNASVMLGVNAIAQITGIVLTLLYAIFFIRKYDATPGKMALGLKVFRPDGAKLSKGRITGRYFAEWLSSITLLIGYLMVAFDKEERRALHDRIADTRVIRVR